MHILGLTGSIAMGKSSAAAMLQRLGVPVHDADATVHTLLSGTALPAVRATFPEVISGGTVDRIALGTKVFGDPTELRRLEAILHPLVHEAEQGFLRRAAARHVTLVALDIPLLFETEGEWRCDAVVVVTAPRFLQTQRALRRAGMTSGRLEAIRACQISEAEKRHRANFIVPSGLGRGTTLRYLIRIIRTMRTWPIHCWPPRSLPSESQWRCRYA